MGLFQLGGLLRPVLGEGGPMVGMGGAAWRMRLAWGAVGAVDVVAKVLGVKALVMVPVVLVPAAEPA